MHSLKSGNFRFGLSLMFPERFARTRIQYAALILGILFFRFGRAVEQSSVQQAGINSSGQGIVTYIAESWRKLTRSTEDCASLVDPKLANITKTVVYLPRHMRPTARLEALQTECKVQIEILPREIVHLGDISPDSLPHPGLLYLPNPYVVPGGRFNEMYGWDSYFIVRGLVDAGDLDLARSMVENFFFEIENYGAILNANRTYYLTRSQPPFLTSMILAVYDAEKMVGHADREWLIRAYSYAQRDYAQWTRAPKLAGNTGLSRYFDVGTGPVPEIADDPTYYATVAGWLIAHPGISTGYLAMKNGNSGNNRNHGTGIGPEIHVPNCQSPACQNGDRVRFTADYYEGDRAMRESGFDVSFRFGPFSGSTHHFAPVCLNSLLYKAEKDLEEMARLLDRPQEALAWRHSAALRRKRINRFLWNPRLGIFTDYNFYTGRSSVYRYATTFYPLWTGLATKAQANAIMKNVSTFELPGGISMSGNQTGVQWDKPYAWAPIQMLAVEGMRRYGFGVEAGRITKEFLSMVEENFLRDGTIREKYNALTRSSEVNVAAGYQSNVIGFGWTNASFMVLLHELTPEDQKQMLANPKPLAASTPWR